jgi:hypothetical protein
VTPLAMPLLRTESAPPLETISPTAAPPPLTVSPAPLLMTVALSDALKPATISVAPDPTKVALKLKPPELTWKTPPELTVVALAEPPASSSSVPPLKTVWLKLKPPELTLSVSPAEIVLLVADWLGPTVVVVIVIPLISIWRRAVVLMARQPKPHLRPIADSAASVPVSLVKSNCLEMQLRHSSSVRRTPSLEPFQLPS